MTGFQAVTVVTIAGAMVFGVVIAFLGSIKLALAERLQLKEQYVAGLVSALYLALIPMVLGSGLLIDFWSVRGVMIIGSILVALGMFALTVHKTYSWAFLSVLLIGAGGACVSTATVVLMPQAFFEPAQAAQAAEETVGHLKKEEVTARLNMGNVFFGLGSLITPAIVGFFLPSMRFHRFLRFLAILCLAPAILAAITQLPKPTDQGQVRLPELAHDPRLWLAGAVCFFYFPIESAINTWATTYLKHQGFTNRMAEFLLSLFFLCFLGSRLACALLGLSGYLNPDADPWLVMLISFAAALCLGHLVGAPSNSIGTTWISLLLLGILLGPIFPTLIGVIFRKVPESHWGTVYGSVFAIGSAGSVILSPFIGFYANRRTVRDSLRIPMLLALLLAAAAASLGLMLQFNW